MNDDRMTPEALAKIEWLAGIRERIAKSEETREFDIVEEITVAWEDRDALLAEVERLNDEIKRVTAEYEGGAKDE